MDAAVLGGRSRTRVRRSARTTSTSTSDFTSSYGLSASDVRRATLRSQTDFDADGRARALGRHRSSSASGRRAPSSPRTDARPVPIRRWVAGLFAEARYQPAVAAHDHGRRARRAHRARRARGRIPTPSRRGRRFGTDSRPSVNPRVSAAFLLAGAARRARSAGRGSTRRRAPASAPPDAFEIAFTDNPSLQPERSRSVEAGVDQAFAARARSIVGATFFYNRYDDLIVAVGPASRTPAATAPTTSRTPGRRGSSCPASARTGWGLTARASATRSSTPRSSRWISLDGRAAAVRRRRPAAAPAASPGVARPDVRARPAHGVRPRGRPLARARRRADLRHLRRPVLQPRVHRRWTSGASWRIVPAVEVIGRVGNLFDRRYEETLGFPALGRNAMVGVRVAAGR